MRNTQAVLITPHQATPLINQSVDTSGHKRLASFELQPPRRAEIITWQPHHSSMAALRSVTRAPDGAFKCNGSMQRAFMLTQRLQAQHDGTTHQVADNVIASGL